MKEFVAAVCGRLAALRVQHYGSRGKAKFAQDLGIRPSTYGHYEEDRLPPADILLRAARLTGARLEWLITGEGDPAEPKRSPRQSLADRFASRVRNLLAERPELASHVEHLLELMEKTTATETAPRTPSRPPSVELIPVVGSTSAGSAHFWRERPESTHGPEADARLETVLAACDQIGSRVASLDSDLAGPSAASLVQFSTPDEQGLLEFLSAPELKMKHPRGVAWRIDGDSMSPRYEDGDLVVTTPDAPAVDALPAVIRQRDQIGVNCKLYQRDGSDVLLIPVNERYPTQRVPADQIRWAWRVVASIRLSRVK